MLDNDFIIIIISIHHADNTVMQVSWLHNCTIIRLIHTGSNYTRTATAATAHPAASTLALDLPMWSLGKQWVWEAWESPPLMPLQDLQGYCTLPGVLECTSQLGWHVAHLKIETSLYIWQFSASQERYIGNIYKYYICIYTKHQQRLTLELTPSKFISFQTSPLSRGTRSTFLYD